MTAKDKRKTADTYHEEEQTQTEEIGAATKSAAAL